MDFLNQLRETGIEIPIAHAANSAAIINMPEAHLDMVRAGISIYGLYTSEEMDRSAVELKPAMELKTKIIHLKKVPAGFKVSYGITYETKKPTTIATVSIGYADGLNRLLSSRGRMLVCGKSAPIVGRVCMDLTMLDVGDIPEAAIGEEVVVFGKQGNASITVDEIASTINTINYEVVSTIMPRVPRIY
jgi:alanine racemase